MSPDKRIPEQTARAIWRRAAQLQAEAEHRLEERAGRIPSRTGTDQEAVDGLRPEDVRAAAEEAGISPEFVQIALAEAAASKAPTTPMGEWDVMGAKVFLGASRRTIEATTTLSARVDAVTAAVLQVFTGHPCLLQADEVAELPASAGRVIVFNVPKFDWSVTANPPFIEKAAMIGLRQLHVAVRPLQEDPGVCEVVVVGDLHDGMRSRWRLSAATSVGGSAAGAAWGLGLAGSALAGAVLVLPALAGAAVVSGAAVAAWVGGYRYYRRQVEAALEQSLQLLPAAARALGAYAAGRERDPSGSAGPPLP